MSELENFHKLKIRILTEYQKSYPHFQGDWKNFSSKDIRQLIDLVEIRLKERISEKWIYTHLKPETNEKLPRKDMLDIFAGFVGDSDWDEFVFKNQQEENQVPAEIPVAKAKKRISWYWLLVIVPVIVFGIFHFVKKKNPQTIEIKNQYTNSPVDSDEIEVYKVIENQKTPIEVVDSKVEIDNETQKILIESPYFETREIKTSKKIEKIYVKPEDYALVLKNFIQSDLKEWEDRKTKLDKILSEDLEVILILKDNLGAEYLNKSEFSGKLIVPTSETKKMKILSLETNEQKQITFIRIQQF